MLLSSLDIMKACLQKRPVPVDDRTLYDLRYFYVDANQVAHYTCGVAFETMMRQLRIRTEQFCQDEWYATVRSSGNPVVQGFVAEDICLAAIGKDGLMVVNEQLGPMSRATFTIKPQWDLCFRSSAHTRYLFVPSVYNFRAVDGVILLLDRANQMAHMLPIQITLSMRQRDSDEVFYTTMWSDWVTGLTEAGLVVQSTFIYIDRKQPTAEVVPEVVKVLRNATKVVHPEYRRIHVGIEQVDRRLASALGIV
jgi:hypothetical protein